MVFLAALGSKLTQLRGIFVYAARTGGAKAFKLDEKQCVYCTRLLRVE
jgi:hypothetical protein